MMTNFNVSIQSTSNAKIVKFEINSFLTQYTSYEFGTIDEAQNSPLAQQLFHLPFVKKIYISGNFIAIECYDIVAWEDVQDDVANQIENYLNDGGVVIMDDGIKKTAFTVYAESTPNPAVLKFVSNKNLVTSLVEFTSIEEAKISPLAMELFNFPFVKNIFIEKNYISITKNDSVDWNEITNQLREFIKSFLENGKEVLLSNAINDIKKSAEQLDAEFDSLDDISKQIVNIIEEYVKPAVASDGGNIQFESYDADTKRVRVILQGACSGCPSSTITLKNGIENMLKEMLHGKVEIVEAING
jgi:Fe-S cluster biogenesis protein NfuA